ncbi:O-antigen ligase family protein [Vibrio lentus]|nr:O-antigen ligase family protein [Vibrio lentus]
MYSSLPRLSSETEVFQKKYEQSIEASSHNHEGLIQNKAEKLTNPTSKINNIFIADKTTDKTTDKTDALSPRNKATLILDNIDKDIPYTSIGLRFHFWIDTIKQSLFNPIFGLGNNANKYILENSKHAVIYKKYNYQHLHSSYMELIASSGLVGVALLGYLYIYVFNISRRKAPNEIIIFSICLYSFLIIINFFESYLFVKSGVLIHTLVLGVLYSYNFEGDIKNEAK